MNVPLFSVAGWACDFGGDRHVFTKAGSKIVVRHNGYRPRANADLVSRGATVERTRLRQLLPHAIKGWGNNTNGNDQGGQGIDLQPVWSADTMAALDGTIERHPVCAFRHDGMPLTRADIGYAFEYVPANDTPNEERLPGYRVPSSSSWQRIDPAHLCRAFNPALVAWRERRDPVAFWWLQVIDNDVRLEYADKAVTGGEYPWSLAQILERTRTIAKGTAQFGELRHHAHSLRAVVEAHRALGAATMQNAEVYAKQRAWIIDFVEMVHNVQAPNGAMTMNDIYSGQDQGAPWTVDQVVATANRGPFLFGPTAALLRGTETECVSWQAPYMLRALYEAHVVLRDAETTSRVRDVVRRWMAVWRTCQLLPAEYGGGHTLPKYLVVQSDGQYRNPINEGIGHGLSQWDADSFQVARALGVRG